MSTNDIPPDLPDVISFYDRYVTLCERLGIEPVAPGRAADLIEQWGAMLYGEDSSAATRH